MKKLPEQFSVYARTEEEAKYICQKQKELCCEKDEIFQDRAVGDKFYRFSPNAQSDKYGYNSESYINPEWDHFNYYNIKHEFTFGEFKSYFEEEFVLPETWYVVVTEENKDVLSKWRFGNGKKLYVGDITGMFDWAYLDDRGIRKEHNDRVNNEWKNEITFEQFKKYVLKENKVKKEIIGFKLIKPQYEEAALKISSMGNEHSWKSNLRTTGWNFQSESYCATKLREAGVLDLWFEPVYKEVKKDIVLTLTNGKQVTVTKEGKIMAEGNEFDALKLRRLYAFMFEPQFEHINGLKVTANAINIGCWKNIEAKDLRLILETQDQQSK